MSGIRNRSALSDYVDFQNGYAFKSDEYTNSGHYLIRIKNVQQGYIEMNDDCFVEIPSDSKFKKFILKDGDIVISLTGNVGRIARIRKEHLPAVLNQRVARVSPKNTKELDPEYLYYLLRSPEFLDFAISSGKGAAQQNISTSDLEKYEVWIPKIEIQREVVLKLDRVFSEIEELERNSRELFSLHEKLRQSFLNKAFTEVGEK